MTAPALRTPHVVFAPGMRRMGVLHLRGKVALMSFALMLPLTWLYSQSLMATHAEPDTTRAGLP